MRAIIAQNVALIVNGGSIVDGSPLEYAKTHHNAAAITYCV